MQYRPWADGEITTSQLFFDSLPRYAYKLTNLDRASSPEMLPDPDLWFEVEANATYLVEFSLFAGGATGAQFQGGWGVPFASSVTKRRGVSGPHFGATDDNPINIRTTVPDVVTTPLAFGYRPAGNESLNHIHEEGLLETGDFPGVLSYEWGQYASSTTFCRLGRGSWARVQRLA
ncbi:hypothetical protein ACFPA8_07930 [Streptomyces ovatisporus]|uniref:Uncharacterized protein n=1 Tax=Streptomyces ovatisporus TaxID=1128682 RepID=A0ABV9A5S7_9ACTN